MRSSWWPRHRQAKELEDCDGAPANIWNRPSRRDDRSPRREDAARLDSVSLVTRKSRNLAVPAKLNREASRLGDVERVVFAVVRHPSPLFALIRPLGLRANDFRRILCSQFVADLRGMP